MTVRAAGYLDLGRESVVSPAVPARATHTGETNRAT